MNKRSYVARVDAARNRAEPASFRDAAGAPTAATALVEDRDDACDVFVADREKVARVRAGLMDAREIGALAETFRVLGDPTRVRILDALAAAELCVCDLATLLGVSESAVSHQLRLLRTMRIVRSRRAGRMVYYALDDQHVTALFDQGLRHVEEARGGTLHPPRRAAVGEVAK